ncbi:MAG: hypothetical protein ABI891_12595 [Acidobacteriota bacterium]
MIKNQEKWFALEITTDTEVSEAVELAPPFRAPYLTRKQKSNEVYSANGVCQCQAFGRGYRSNRFIFGIVPPDAKIFWLKFRCKFERLTEKLS